MLAQVLTRPHRPQRPRLQLSLLQSLVPSQQLSLVPSLLQSRVLNLLQSLVPSQQQSQVPSLLHQRQQNRVPSQLQSQALNLLHQRQQNQVPSQLHRPVRRSRDRKCHARRSLLARSRGRSQAHAHRVWRTTHSRPADPPVRHRGRPTCRVRRVETAVRARSRVDARVALARRVETAVRARSRVDARVALARRGDRDAVISQAAIVRLRQ